MKYKNIKFLVLLSISLLWGCQSIGTKETTFISKVDLPEYTAKISYELLMPEGEGPFPVVILMHGCQGTSPVNAANAYMANKAHAEFLNKNGYAAAILDSFSSRGMGGEQTCSSYLDLAVARRFRVSDAYNALEHLSLNRKINTQNAFLIGQSNGGSTAVNAAKDISEFGVETTVKFKAIAAYYPWCGDLGVYYQEPFKTPLMIMSGDKDSWTPMGSCQAAAKLRKNTEKPDLTFIAYKGAEHSFDLPIERLKFVGYVVEGNPRATIKSRDDYLRCFNSYMN